MKRMALLSAFSVYMAIILTACAGNITLKPEYQPQTKSSAPLASAPASKVKLLSFEDKRSETIVPTLIGRRDAAFGVPMGDVISERPVSEIMRTAVGTELIRNGHSIVADGEDVSIKGKILKFWVGTDVTAAYWDVIGEISIAIEVTRPKGGTSFSLGPYSGKNLERTYINPSEGMVKRVLLKSLEDAMSSMSSDSEFIKVLNTR